VQWIACTGGPREVLPERFGKHATIYQWFNRWARKERWHAIFEALQEPGLEWVILDYRPEGQQFQSAKTRASRDQQKGEQVHVKFVGWSGPPGRTP
jgi:transposase